jgi:hypothetical protein
MGSERPPGAQRGAVLQEWELSIDVDGSPVLARGRTILETDVAPWRWLVVIGLGAVAVAAAGRGRSVLVASLALLGLSVAALPVGWAEFVATPSDGGRRPLLWMLPALAMVAAVAALLMRRRRAGAVLVLAAVALLGAWGIYRFGVLTNPVLPTDLDVRVDRLVTALALGGSAGAAIACIWSAAFARPAVDVPEDAAVGDDDDEPEPRQTS